MDLEKKRHERNCQLVAFAKWLNWVKLRKKTQAVASEKLESLVNAGRLKRIIAAWRNVLKDSKRTKEYYKRLQMGIIEIGNKVNQTEEGCDILSMLPSNLSLKINFSVEKDWITEGKMKQILQNYRPFVIHLNLRGCTTLKGPSLKCISEYCTFNY
ncbi:hypothetical protein JOQ06_003188 [Pogonophryne albipinna]|uniref:Uncharacterized protein n=1 Tax=Pogonophryne albipinna TaxID=1090488 RepID=A0AAD6B9B7_9TELE|nr:hypothetical protein JOQ06_003188 [Pogonophryne albipinna]